VDTWGSFNKSLLVYYHCGCSDNVTFTKTMVIGTTWKGFCRSRHTKTMCDVMKEVLCEKVFVKVVRKKFWFLGYNTSEWSELVDKKVVQFVYKKSFY